MIIVWEWKSFRPSVVAETNDTKSGVIIFPINVNAPSMGRFKMFYLECVRVWVRVRIWDRVRVTVRALSRLGLGLVKS